MSTFHLDRMFHPQSIAVVGASPQPGVGRAVLENLLAGGFRGPILPVNPKHASVCGVLAYASIDDLPLTPDLAVICTPPATVPGVVAQLGKRGVQAAIVITAGLELCQDVRGRSLQQATLDIAWLHSMRLLGPNCVGLISSEARVNASFAPALPLPGDLAFITQSGALATAVLDWARSNRIGFSHFVSVGNSADVDFGDLVNYLADDRRTRAILMYVEAIADAPKFMDAAQRASRRKPIVAVKAGRVAEGARAAASHTGALAGVDDVYDAALRQAGVLRVDSLEALFNAVELLARSHPLCGDRLAILTNGGGFGVMAVDALVMAGGRPATLSADTVRRLDAQLPPNWSRSNPVDIIGDATAERYAAALDALLQDDAVDAVLVLNAPTALVPNREIARALTPIIRRAARPVLTCWLGRDGVASARRLFARAGVPSFDTPEDAIHAFVDMARYHARQAVAPTAAALPAREGPPHRDEARRIVEQALRNKLTWLAADDARQLLACYEIATLDARHVADPQEAAHAAEQLGFPVALKILSPDITHKSDVGGVHLGLRSAAEVLAAAAKMGQRIAKAAPAARLAGFTVQQMVNRPHAHELIVGVANDRTFGPVILFGQGGVSTEVVADKAVALPPLTAALADELIARTQVARRLAGYRDRPPVDHEALVSTLLAVSQLAIDLPEIAELDVNPLLADESGALALDVRARIVPATRNAPCCLPVDRTPNQRELLT